VDLRERDVLCNADGCFVVYLQRKTFLDSWRACKEKGGNLATIKSMEEATAIATLFSTLDLRHSRTKIQVWIGLQRQPRQCTTTRPLRGFSWTTGDQDTEYTNWQKEDSPSMCSVPRCVVMGYSTQEQNNNFKWLDGSCSVPVDGYLCHYAYKGMCPSLWSEGGGNALYTTPFNLLSTLLTHVPFGSVATVPCPTGAKEEQSVLCMLREDGSVGWSREPPLCSDPSISHNWCDQDNGGCEHFCRPAGGHFYCECADGYQLGDDGQSCELSDVCQGAPCEFECLPLSDGYRCYPTRESSKFPKEDLGEEEKDYVEITHSRGLVVPTQFIASQPPPSKGEGSGDPLDSVQEDRGQKQSSTWLLVGLLVPICIFIVVMVAFGIVYCTRCAVQPRNKNATDCYHWISGAHDKQGAPNPSAGTDINIYKLCFRNKMFYPLLLGAPDSWSIFE
uniref:Endosialin-like n=1 Tax=Stegastes partitus TaxID=144197 RepID=A0A3B4ZH17_9TELE